MARFIEDLDRGAVIGIPVSAIAARTATTSSISLPTRRAAAAARLVRDSANCSTVALAMVFAFTSTSDTRPMFLMFSAVSSTVRPRALWLSVSRSVARAMSNAPALANAVTWGSAARDCAAFRPALAR